MSAVAGRGPTSKGLAVNFASRASGARVVRSVGVRPEASSTSAAGAHESGSVVEADSDFVQLQLGQRGTLLGQERIHLRWRDDDLSLGPIHSKNSRLTRSPAPPGRRPRTGLKH